MNVIVSNKYTEELQKLGIDVIKSLSGNFEVDEIISTFKNFFFQRMILDLTAIKNYKDTNNLKKLATELDASKIILLLASDSEEPGSGATNPLYLSNLIEMGIYNFTRNIEGVMYLYNNPNSYKDVAQYHEINIVPKPTPADSYSGDFVGSNTPIDTDTSVNNDFTPVGNANNSFGPVASTVNNDFSPVTPNNINNNFSEVAPNPVNNSFAGVQANSYSLGEKKIVGVKNVTEGAGSTSLVYMMKKELERNYTVAAIEIDKRDFMYFPDQTMISTTRNDVLNVISGSNKEVILIDLNNDAIMEQKCDIVVYLIEPSTIKLNKLMLLDPNKIRTLLSKRVVLNKSMLAAKDVYDFEAESGLKIFFNMPPLDDREFNNGALNAFLTKLGFSKTQNGELEKKKKILGIF